MLKGDCDQLIRCDVLRGDSVETCVVVQYYVRLGHNSVLCLPCGCWGGGTVRSGILRGGRLRCDMLMCDVLRGDMLRGDALSGDMVRGDTLRGER